MNKFFILSVVCFSLAAVVLVKTAIERFHEVQKYFRLQEYASEVEDIGESLKALEHNSLTLKNNVQVLEKIAKRALQYFNASSSSPPPTPAVVL